MRPSLNIPRMVNKLRAFHLMGEKDMHIAKKYVKPYTYSGAIGIPTLNYTYEELEELNRYEQYLGNNITTWMTTSITGTKPTKEAWLKFISDNRAAIDNVIKLNQTAYDRYLQATN